MSWKDCGFFKIKMKTNKSQDNRAIRLEIKSTTLIWIISTKHYLRKLKFINEKVIPFLFIIREICCSLFLWYCWWRRRDRPGGRQNWTASHTRTGRRHCSLRFYSFVPNFEVLFLILKFCSQFWSLVPNVKVLFPILKFFP